MKEVPKISVDGLAPNSYHLSHWKGNQTPSPLKADTATEIVFRYQDHPERKDFFPQVGIVTNTHFDTDGLLSAWTFLNAKRAESMAERFIAAAEASDFSSFVSEEGVQIHLLIEGLCRSQESPLAEIISAYSGPREAAYYKGLLPLVPDLFRKKDQYRQFWQTPFEDILASMALFEKGLIGLEEYDEEGLSVVINDCRPAPQAIDHHCQGDLILIVEDKEKAEGGFAYELEYRYYAWADTVSRPPIKIRSMKPLAEMLNRIEGSTPGRWMCEGYLGKHLTSALKYTDEGGARLLSPLHPNEVIRMVLSHLKTSESDEN